MRTQYKTKTRGRYTRKLTTKQIQKLNKTGRVWTAGNKTTIRQLTKSTAPAHLTLRRLQGLVQAFKKQARRKGISLAKANGRGRH